MAVPAWYVRGIKARHVATFNDDVFQNFVDRVANVNVTVCVRWAVVQQEGRSTFARLADGLIYAFFLPLCHPEGFATRQIATHRKWGVRQVECLFIVHEAQNKPALAVHRHAWRQSGLEDQETSLRLEDV